MLPAQMMKRPLLISSVLEYAAECYGDVEVVSARVEGDIYRLGYRAMARRCAKLATLLMELGVKPGDRVATLAWNGHRHLELYYAISGIGAVCHTINPRLTPDQIAYVVGHAGDVALFYDTTFQPLIDKLKPAMPSLRHIIAMTGPATMPATATACYETLLEAAQPLAAWPEFDENTASGLCYTSGTTAEPKGVLYSHRSSVLHALFVITQYGRGFGPDRTILPVVPLFHVNAWGLPYLAPLTGTRLVMPGPKLDGASVFALMEAENVTASWGVPTVWAGLLTEMRSRGRAPIGLKDVLVGGSAPPRSMVETFERDYDICVIQGWGMTEMSPIGSKSILTPEQDEQPFEKRIDQKIKAGRRMFGVDFKIVDEHGTPLPHDGVASGELHVRGNTVAAGYYNNEKATAAALDGEGWFKTGDVARIEPNGFLTIVDRSKDLVKSGGEWISSIDVESAAMSTPGLANCALIAVASERWSERPLMICVRQAGAATSKEEVLAQLSKTLAKWQMPDDVIFVEALPMTATGKVSKKDLRAAFAAKTA